MNSTMKVQAWQEEITIPTYKIGEPDRNPMFLEKRVYQGSSGVVYPHAVIDKVYDEKYDKKYNAIFIENQYIKVMILPELGGRIQMAYDKTNNYHFVYYNQVVKPALVGLAGPWISGGIEFNWPQHHRPTTFDAVDFTIENNPNGSATVWCSDMERMFRTKGLVGFTLYPDKAYIEITGKLQNRTPFPQTFLWWANPAVAVDEHYQSVFPPDVNAVYDHGKRDVSTFPIATGTYYKIDYSPGTDISRYKNIPVPTSYMAVNSKYDFVGGYHHQKKAGILHVANHHQSPGKKQWTWGHGEFGQAWDRHLTDEDGPYFELMTGMFTDNQPDFSYVMPGEERTFKQYFMPYKNIGYVKNATTEAMINLEIDANVATIDVYTTSEINCKISLFIGTQQLFTQTTQISPINTFKVNVNIPANCNIYELKAVVENTLGNELVSYTPERRDTKAVPNPAKPMLQPAEMESCEQLYLAGLHLEQYRHATFSATHYYAEALKRDPNDIRNNNAMGLWLLKRGKFAESEAYFRKAIETLTLRNPNPYDGEPLYNLGLALFYQLKYDEAYNYFFKATWNAAWQDNAFYYLALIDTRKGKYVQALDFINNSLNKNTRSQRARMLKVVILRKLAMFNEAIEFANLSIKTDVLDFAAYNELYVLHKLQNSSAANTLLSKLVVLMRNEDHSYIELAVDYMNMRLFDDAAELLARIDKSKNPIPHYYRAYCLKELKNDAACAEVLKIAANCNPDTVFPNRLEDICKLKFAVEQNTTDYKALYYLGNLWYDKRQFTEAITCWEQSVTINPNFATINRNLALAYYNKLKQPQKALQMLQKAFECNNTDSRVLFELDQLYKKLQHAPQNRLEMLKKYINLVNNRDDLYLEYVTLHNLLGQYQQAYNLLMERNFHPWEGGEGKVTRQFVIASVELAKLAIDANDPNKAIQLLLNTEHYPKNLGEGKIHGAQENDVYYTLALAYQALGKHAEGNNYLKKASQGLSEPTAAIFYNDQPPEMIYYQGLAHLKLAETNVAQAKFNRLIEYGQQHLNDEVRIDYFAVSLPEMQIFDDDLNMRNRCHCYFLMALGYKGLQQIPQATECFNSVLNLEIAHLGVALHKGNSKN